MPHPLQESTRPADAGAGLVALFGSGELGAAAARVAEAAAAFLDLAASTGRPRAEQVEGVVAELAAELDLGPDDARAVLFLAGLRLPDLLSLPPAGAVESIVALFCALAPTEEASLWWRVGGRRLVHVTGSGGGARTRSLRAAAADVIAGTPLGAGSRRSAWAVPIATRPAALAYRCRPRDADACTAYAREAASAIAPLLVLEDLLRHGAAREQSLVESSERRLVRVGFDLHDGPMQDIAALAQDVRLFRAQLGTLLEESEERRRIALGRVDDVEARLLALDHDLRQIAGSLQSPTALRLPFLDVLEQELAGFGPAAGVELEVVTTGDFDDLTSSQKIALLRIVQESLANVREHSGAARVTVRIHGGRSRLTAEITDDGRGFDVGQRLDQAARAGRMGLVGMGERVRLLGGRFDVESAVGGPTRVRASIPRWRPLPGAPQDVDAR